MTAQTIEIVAQSDKAKAMASLELAFVADPVMRWFWPGADIYRSAFSRFVEAIAGTAFESGMALSADGGHGVALWLPPGFEGDDDAITQVTLDTVDPGILIDLSAFADLIRGHHPTFEHWYLPFMGVDPIAQGKGLGSNLLQHTVAICDRDQVPAYLEASTLRSRLLYERVGFQVTGAIQAGASPQVYAMLRSPTPQR